MTHDERYPLTPAQYQRPGTEALRQLASDDAMRDAGQTVMRIDVTPEEHALLLAVHAMNAARQARADVEAQVTEAIAHLVDYAAGLTESARYAQGAAKRAFEDALSAVDTPATQNTGEDDCS